MDDSEAPASESTELFIIHDDVEFDLAALQVLAPDRRLTELTWDQRDSPPAGARVLLRLSDEHIRELTPVAVARQWQLGLLPHPEAPQAMRSLGIKGDVDRVFTHYLDAEPIDADVLSCNDQVVLSSVVIGKVLTLGPYDASRPPTRRHLFIAALKAIPGLSLRGYRLTTGKDHTIQTAALGMVALEQTQSTLVGRSFSEALSVNDGRLSLLAFAPRSILAYLWSMLRLLFPGKFSLSRLPPSVALIASNRVLIQAPQSIDYALDGKPVSAKEIELRVLEQRLCLLPGPAMSLEQDQQPARDKDSIKLNHLPVTESARQLTDVPLPLFSHASEEDYRELFVSLRDNATPTSAYLVLMCLSVLLAMTGLFANSAPVIIGAMILAPLMAPIVSFAMGLARTEPKLIHNSLRTLGAGIGLGLFCAVTVTWVMPLETPTAEMRSRLTPSLLDLFVAVISGIASAYAHAKEEIAKSLAGVAIAVALVPPLSVAGIGIGWADWSMAHGALLLFFTNLVGISLAASATFLVMGFAPFKLARKGLAITLLLVAVVIGPLYIAFEHLVEQSRILRLVPNKVELAGRTIDVHVVKVRTGDPPRVVVVLSTPRLLDESNVDALKKTLIGSIGRPIELEAQINLRR